jgi:lipoprotein LprG
MPTPLGWRASRPAHAVGMIAVFALLIAALAGCTKKTPASDLPPGPDLVRESSTAMASVQSAHVVITTEGDVADLPLRKADGSLTREGNAKGTIQLEQFNALIEYDFVVFGETIYLKGVTGGWTQLPVAMAATIYDPSAILDPDRGVAKVLATATEAKTEAKESVDGRDTYRVGVKLDRAATAQLVPGVGDGVTGQLWIAVENKRLLKALLRIPAQDGGTGGTVTIGVSDIDAPVSISAPV